MPRPCHCRRVAALPKMTYFKPRGVPMSELAECRLSVDGLEALRLADYQDLNMDEAAARMGVSRHTFGRLLRKARRCVAEALIEGHALRIEGGVCALVDTSETQGALDMSQSILVAVPSDAPGGLEAAPSAHFGHCDAAGGHRAAGRGHGHAPAQRHAGRGRHGLSQCRAGHGGRCPEGLCRRQIATLRHGAVVQGRLQSPLEHFHVERL